MPPLSKALLMIFLLASIPYLVTGQDANEVYELAGMGTFQNQRAMITGQKVYGPVNALGNYPFRFVGTLRSP